MVVGVMHMAIALCIYKAWVDGCVAVGVGVGFLGRGIFNIF